MADRAEFKAQAISAFVDGDGNFVEYQARHVWP